jgi:phospholipid/cholesterol/gamma-HCH transport system substrate-binding protein
MTDKQLQFRVGLFVITAFGVIAAMAVLFGEFQGIFSKQYQLLVHFESAPGVLEGSPVRVNGIPIGKVGDLVLDKERGGVLLILTIDEEYELRSDSIVMLQQSLLGDALLEFTPGVSPDPIDRTQVLEGKPAFDVMAVVQRMETQMTTTMASFEDTSKEWQTVAQNINKLVDTNEGNLSEVIESTVVSLREFTTTMSTAGKAFDSANRVIGDKKTVENLRKALAGLPLIVDETQATIQAMRQTVTSINGNLRNIEGVTQPLAKHTTSIVVRLDKSLANLQGLTADLRLVSQMATKKDGSFQKFLSDPSLYRDLERSATSMALLLENLNPVVRDMRVFADKVARRPELMGVGGALRPSTGLKDDEQQGVRPANFQQRQNK